MNKREFVEQLSKNTGLSKKSAGETLEAMLGMIVDTTKKKQKVSFSGFGTFEARQMKATERLNPRTGKRFKVPAKFTPKFRAGKSFKEAIQ